MSLFLFGIAAISLLIGPRVPLSQQKHQCVVDLHIVGPFGVSLNCDSPEFMKDAVHPSLLLRKNSVRQSRPGMILAAYLLSKPLFFLNHLAHYLHPNVTRKDIAASRVNALWQSGFSVYAAYFLLNLVILIFACYFYFELVAGEEGVSLAALSFILFLFINPITQTYLWSPHTQMFNIMGPLFLCFLFYRGFSERISDKWWYGITAVMSLLVTAYGTFLLYAPALFFIFLYHYWNETDRQGRIGFYATKLVCHAAIFILPTLIWYVTVKHVAGSYYVHEAVVYRQFVWMSDAYRNGFMALLSQLGLNIFHVLQLIAEQGYILLCAIVVLCLLLKKQAFDAWDKQKLMAIVITLLFCALFVVFNGFVIARMVSTVIPVMIACCGYLVECLFLKSSSQGRRLLTVFCVLFAVLGASLSL